MNYSTKLQIALNTKQFLFSQCLEADTCVISPMKGSSRSQMERLQKKSRARRYLRKMIRVVLWAILFTLVALFLGYYLDTPVPQEIPEKWKVKLIDASMRTYGHLVRVLASLCLVYILYNEYTCTYNSIIKEKSCL